jgi:hypothetical protein
MSLKKNLPSNGTDAEEECPPDQDWVTPNHLKNSLLMLEEIVGHQSCFAIGIGGIRSGDRLDVRVLD